MSEIPLPGGFINTVARVGNTVRRSPGPEFSARLLAHFAAHGWPGAPRHLGTDEQGREVLEYLDGVVPWDCPHATHVRTAAALETAARLLRECHDLTAGTSLAGDHEVVCHNDLSPKNTVYRDHGAGLVPIAFIDWDIAAPGDRVHDVAHLCWQFGGLGPDADPAESGLLLRRICDAYAEFDRHRLVGTILWWQDRCWRGIEAGDNSAMMRLRQLGVPAQIRAAHEWVARNRAVLEEAISRR